MYDVDISVIKQQTQLFLELPAKIWLMQIRKSS